MKDRSVCDTCVLLDGSAKPRLGLECTEINNTHRCKVCLLFGRPCCSYNLDVGGFGPPVRFSEASIQGTDAEMLAYQISSDDVNLNNKWLSTLIVQPLKSNLVQNFQQQLMDFTAILGTEYGLGDSKQGAVEELADGDEN